MSRSLDWKAEGVRLAYRGRMIRDPEREIMGMILKIDINKVEIVKFKCPASERRIVKGSELDSKSYVRESRAWI
jgi:hypothetical protein